MDMAIQSQTLSVHVLPSQLYILYGVNKKHLFTSYPAAKHKNTANLSLQTCDKNQRLLHDTCINFSFRNNVADLGVFTKVLVPVGSIIPCVENLETKNCLFNG